MLPTLLTLGNLYFGFAAVYCVGRELQDLGAGVHATDIRTLNSDFIEARAPSFLAIAAWMLVAAMICDALDGRVARRTGQASKFGEQLDSLADVVSFGVAPAFMMIVLIRRELAQWGFAPFGFDRFPQMAVFIGVVYVCCTALRLARFNVEASLEEASHRGFKGLPSPAGAAGLASLIFLHDHLDITLGYRTPAEFIARVLPLCTLVLALLMVSRVPYTHAVSSFLRRRPFGHVVLVLLVVPFLLLYTQLMTVILSWAFVLSGPVRMTGLLLRRHRPDADAPGMQPRELPSGDEATSARPGPVEPRHKTP
jgi:CDP-diacylglycerol---serine O-phosphatidyltransferase